MDALQCELTDAHLQEICDTLVLETIVVEARKSTHMRFTAHDYENVMDSTASTRDQKIIRLLDLLKKKTGAWKFLIEHVRKQGNVKLASKLLQQEAKRKRRVSSDDGDTIQQSALFSQNHTDDLSEELHRLQQKLKIHINNQVDGILRFWRNVLPNTDFNATYVELNLCNDDCTPSGKVVGYSYVWNTNGKRILIEGDPGTGKTIYAHQLANQWANDPHSDIAKHYDFLFLIILHDVVKPCSSLEELLTHYVLDRESLVDLEMLLQYDCARHERILFVLDGFDEFDNSLCPEIIDVLQLRRLKLATVVYTSRYKPNLLASLKYQCFRTTGFTAEQAQQYIRMQHPVDLNKTECLSCQRLRELQTNPLILAIWCALSQNRIAPDLDMTSSSGYFQLILSFVDLVIRKFGDKGNEIYADQKEQVILCIGSYAAQQLKLHLAYKNMLASYQVKQEILNDERMRELGRKIGLLIQRPDLRTGISVDAFAHQIFEEFFAAKYFIAADEGAAVLQCTMSTVGVGRFLTSRLSYFMSAFSPDYCLNMVSTSCLQYYLGAYLLPWIVNHQLAVNYLKNVIVPRLARSQQDKRFSLALGFYPRTEYVAFRYIAIEDQPPYDVSVRELCAQLNSSIKIVQDDTDKRQCNLKTPPLAVHAVQLHCISSLKARLDDGVDHINRVTLLGGECGCWRKNELFRDLKKFLENAKLDSIRLIRFKLTSVTLISLFRLIGSICFKRLLLYELSLNNEANDALVNMFKSAKIAQSISEVVLFQIENLTANTLSMIAYLNNLQSLIFVQNDSSQALVNAIGNVFSPSSSFCVTMRQLYVSAESAGKSVPLFEGIKNLCKLEILLVHTESFSATAIDGLSAALESLLSLKYLATTETVEEASHICENSKFFCNIASNYTLRIIDMHLITITYQATKIFLENLNSKRLPNCGQLTIFLPEQMQHLVNDKFFPLLKNCSTLNVSFIFQDDEPTLNQAVQCGCPLQIYATFGNQ